MKFVYGKRDWPDRKRGQENCYLLTNGLGGFSSGSMINSNTRNDHALLMAALTAPNVRYNMVNRLEEVLESASEEGAPDITTESVSETELPESGPAGVYKETSCRRTYLSSQEFQDSGRNENGYLVLNSFVYEDYPEWTFQVGGVEIVKRLAMRQGENLVAVEYQIDNRTGREVCLTVTPYLQFTPKGKELRGEPKFEIRSCGNGKNAGAEEQASRPGYAEDIGNGSFYEITSHGLNLLFRTNGDLEAVPRKFCEGMFYAYDACDGRNALGRACVNHRVRKRVPAHGQGRLELIYLAGMETAEMTETAETAEAVETGETVKISKSAEMAEALRNLPESAEEVFREAAEYRKSLRETALDCNPGMEDETVLQLVMSAGQFIAERASTGGRTILAGYPFFEDWGRDTMIALEGCCMATGQMDTAKSILRTFARYCRKGLMPNLFPEGGREPVYNTADAALLFVSSVYAYYKRQSEREFVREMWPVMEEIMNAYRNGTDYGIRMDEDGLIAAGRGLDQVTWMDVRIGDFLPTPRHGKPVEINAYWYNALRAMEQMKRELAEAEKREPGSEEESGSIGTEKLSGFDYGCLAEKVRRSFRQKFWIEEKGYLRDVISVGEEGDSEDAAACGKERDQNSTAAAGAENEKAGKRADEQFRCNQIWAVSMPFTMLDRKQETRVVDQVCEKLYTSLGIRTLNREDADFHGVYGGPADERDRAYHQGTVWVFPLGAYYLAYLRTRDYSADACARVRRQLESMESALREGCIGQLPEIYDGERPAFSRGCFAQAWSVGEILRVYEELGKHE